ncbi:hypothetical protein [Xanthomonas hortorum]|uniref:Uncharacterized protein n=1 Tax=Xanthomonas hortorum pv. pelargonii TaxID=453602 RepID=A0A6V7CHB4_9XANT|nr:hypothetical protein [Xanthomonas hortorum]MCE4353908.1 hypothetical protein [Xanthomonas hortorum pv. pelargonii]MCM5524541.1 hypothetical protein [Xanthomonas hortorum pv. pelargonii]MCM5535742.1 hypothetical protein [Xanthomonas hortorum pv. pelargonii]MCM5546457.1 hypothetical protein [Xanthomonas hortorum pv. pelargonii]MCM5548170.1 hypothetical protein [Xanthomonas hortorum pv. pelargonii]
MLPLPRWARSPRLWAPLRSRALWRVALVLCSCLLLTTIVLRKPLADWLWPDTRIQQLLQRGDAALSRGQLSAADGSGARELFAAALALDSDRSEARAGLARTGAAAVVQARAAIAAGDAAGAQRTLALATALEVPQAQIAPVTLRLRALQARRAGLDALFAQAVAAQRQGRLDGTPDSALPLYQRILTLAPDRTDALEGREDALTDLLAQARHALARDALGDAAMLLAAAKRYDAGHADVPLTEGHYHRVLEQRRQRAEGLLRRGRLAPAARDFNAVLAAEPDDAAARRGLDQVASEYAAQASRQAADFHFDAALQSLQEARALVPGAASIAQAEQAIARARDAQRSPETGLSRGARERRLRALLQRVTAAEAQQQWMTPPGASAYDAVRAAQALAPRDPRVLQAAARVVPASQRCFEDELRNNRLRAARGCLDAWQALTPNGEALIGARRRLAQRWIAVGSERLGQEDAAFARRAQDEARQLDPGLPELVEFTRRVKAVAEQR